MTISNLPLCIVLHYHDGKDEWTFLFNTPLRDMQQLIEKRPCQDPNHYRIFMIEEELPVRKRVDSPKTIYI